MSGQGPLLARLAITDRVYDITKLQCLPKLGVEGHLTVKTTWPLLPGVSQRWSRNSNSIKSTKLQGRATEQTRETVEEALVKD